MKIINKQKLFFYFMLLIMFASITIPSIKFISTNTPKAVNGTMDLRNWDINKDSTIPLNGEWEFYYDKLLYPNDFRDKEPLGETIQKVPSNWNLYKINGQNIPSHGTATYRLKLLLPEESGSYGIKITSIAASARVFADNQLILSLGNPGESNETTEHKFYADTAYFSSEKSEVEILIQTANYTYTNGGITYEIHFGDDKSISSLRMYNLFIDAALISGLLFIAIYFFGLGLQRKNNLDVLFFASYCLFSSIYVSTSSEAILNYAFPKLPYNYSAKIFVLSLILSLFSLYKYAYYSFKVSYTRRTKIIIDGIGILVILLTFFTDFYLQKYSSLISTIGIIYVIILVIQIFIRHIPTKIIGRYYLYTAIVSSVILFITLLLNMLLLLESNFFIPVFQPVFVLSLAFYMSEKYENSFKTIEELSGRLSAIDKLKDDFLARTSHELKTPLNGIINISQSLIDNSDNSLTPDQYEDIRLITSIGRRLSTLVQDILDYSKLKVMDITLNTTTVDVYTLVESTAEVFRYLIRGKPLSIENKILPNKHMVMADENRLKQIISNLLDNAVKFTSQGTIVIDCRQKEDFIFIDVKDTGIGIPKNKLKDIFISYEQLESSSSEKGVGLGLTITKQLIELHMGQIYIESKQGTGSCFTFSIPRGKTDDISETLLKKSEIKENNYNLQNEIKPPHTVHIDGEFSILVVDDEYSNLKALLNILTNSNYNVTIAGNAETALNLLKGTLKYDLCILDIMMPGMSGYEACRKIREEYSPIELPILLLTAKYSPRDLEVGFMAGANDFVEKPFEADELKCRVQTLVQLKKSKDLLLERETAFLQAQIKPHFLFNALNTISSFCYTDPAKAGELLGDLGVFLRNSFDFSSTSSYVSIDKELRIVKAYTSKEKARFCKKLELEFNINPSVLKYRILPLTIQPIVENSIRHGLMKSNQGGKVIVNLTLIEEQINIRIDDTGIGIPEDVLCDLRDLKTGNKGVGLANINHRLLSFYGTSLDISSTADSGTSVSFSIPAREF